MPRPTASSAAMSGGPGNSLQARTVWRTLPLEKLGSCWVWVVTPESLCSQAFDASGGSGRSHASTRY